MRPRFLGSAFLLCQIVFNPAPQALAQEASCLNIYHDEVDASASAAEQVGPMNAIMLANLLGHWPHYEIRVRPIEDFKSADLESCKATFYVSTDPESEVPRDFQRSFFTTSKAVAWVGFWPEKLNKSQFEAAFQHRVSGLLGSEDRASKDPGFYRHVSYKGAVFTKGVEVEGSEARAAFEAVRFVPLSAGARDTVLADLIHNKTYDTSPYFLRSANKFIVGDIPFAYMHEGDRYFAFADLLFDILDEKPLRSDRLAFARTEDIHGYYERHYVEAIMQAHKAENVPVSLAHIPLFMDPFDVYGLGSVEVPRAASGDSEFLALIDAVTSDRRNTIIWHGVTHQFGTLKNPHSGTSGDDYEFWNKQADTPLEGDAVEATLDRLALALPVFDAYGLQPRFWVTPHYQASAMNNQVFAKVFPWQIGRVTYYPSSFGASFTLPAVDSKSGLTIGAVTRERLDQLKAAAWDGSDPRSAQGLTQMFPFEIYRDVYGQRILPETLGYMSYATSQQTAFIRTADDMLADARRNRVVRDYWASFFYHPYIFADRQDGGIGRFDGDTLELRKLLIGLKLLGYSFTGLGEFEERVAGEVAKNAGVPSQAQAAN